MFLLRFVHPNSIGFIRALGQVGPPALVVWIVLRDWNLSLAVLATVPSLFQPGARFGNL